MKVFLSISLTFNSYLRSTPVRKCHLLEWTWQGSQKRSPRYNSFSLVEMVSPKAKGGGTGIVEEWSMNEGNHKSQCPVFSWTIKSTLYSFYITKQFFLFPLQWVFQIFTSFLSPLLHLHTHTHFT